MKLNSNYLRMLVPRRIRNSFPSSKGGLFTSQDCKQQCLLLSENVDGRSAQWLEALVTLVKDTGLVPSFAAAAHKGL